MPMSVACCDTQWNSKRTKCCIIWLLWLAQGDAATPEATCTLTCPGSQGYIPKTSAAVSPALVSVQHFKRQEAVLHTALTGAAHGVECAGTADVGVAGGRGGAMLMALGMDRAPPA